MHNALFPQSLNKKNKKFFFNTVSPPLLMATLAGILLVLGFAPFHWPGLTILGLACFVYLLSHHTSRLSWKLGLSLGFGFFSIGVSWVYVSIHSYGHLSPLLSLFITFLFIFYLSLFPMLVGWLYHNIASSFSLFSKSILFAAIWTVSEYLRAHLFTGFPWLLVGYTLIDTPAKTLLPLIGVYGASFVVCLSAHFLSNSVASQSTSRYLWMILFSMLLILPSFLNPLSPLEISKKPIEVGIIQSNLSMRDKWDETLFWKLIEHYEKTTSELLGTTMIVLPESAIPLPATYIENFLTLLDSAAKKAKSAILLGIPETMDPQETYYYNTLKSLGHAEGHYIKQQLVPFGEYIPKYFKKVSNFLGIPDPAIQAGKKHQSLLTVHGHPIATLICYELGYANLLRKQLPEAEWIVSISDDGWFGHSLAIYQHQQMAQVLSLMTGRYQVVANNDGLSSVMNEKGNIIKALPAYSAGILKTTLLPIKGETHWLIQGDWPVLLLSLILIFLFFCHKVFHHN